MSNNGSIDIFGGEISLENISPIEKRQAKLLQDGFTKHTTVVGEDTQEQIPFIMKSLRETREFELIEYRVISVSTGEEIKISELWVKPKEGSQEYKSRKTQIKSAVSRIVDLSACHTQVIQSESGREYQIFYENISIEERSIKAISVEGEIFFLEEISHGSDGVSTFRNYVHAKNPLITLTLDTKLEISYEDKESPDSWERVRIKNFCKPEVIISRNGVMALGPEILQEFLPDGL